MRKTAMWCAALTLMGCGATMQQLKSRAAVDFECAETRLDVKELDSGTRQVEGCGKRAIYVELFNDSRYPTWLLNSEVRPQPERSTSR